MTLRSQITDFQSNSQETGCSQSVGVCLGNLSKHLYLLAENDCVVNFAVNHVVDHVVNFYAVNRLSREVAIK